MAFCVECGNRLSDIAIECPKCGTPTGVRSVKGPSALGAYPGAPALRPLGIGEIIDVSIKIYRNHALTLLKAVAVVVVPVQIISALILASAAPPDEIVQTPVQPGIGQPTIDTSDVWSFIAGILVTFVLGAVAAQLATGASLKAITDGYLGETPDWRGTLRFAFSRLGSLLWLAIILFVLLTLAFLACFVPGVWLSVSWAVAVPVLLVEGERGWSALKRSFQLVRGRWWQVLGVMFLGRIIAGVVSLVFLVPAQLFFTFAEDNPFVGFLTNALAQSISQTLTTPFVAATIAIVYLDLRVRKEGLDIELLAQRISTAPSALSAPGTEQKSAPSPRKRAAKPRPKPSARAAKPKPRAPKKTAPRKPRPKGGTGRKP